MYDRWASLQPDWYEELANSKDSGIMNRLSLSSIASWGESSLGMIETLFILMDDAYHALLPEADGAYEVTIESFKGIGSKSQQQFTAVFPSPDSEYRFTFDSLTGRSHIDVTFATEVGKKEIVYYAYIDAIPTQKGIYTSVIEEEHGGYDEAPTRIAQYITEDRIYLVSDNPLPEDADISALRLAKAPEKLSQLAMEGSMVVRTDEKGRLHIKNSG